MRAFPDFASNISPRAQRFRFRAFHYRFQFTYTAALLSFLIAPSLVHADSPYYQHVIFDNGLTRDNYFYSYGHAVSPSVLELKNEKLPVESKITFSPPTTLRLAWTSASDGGWTAQIDVVKVRGRPIHFKGANLYLWCYAPDGLAASALRRVSLIDSRGHERLSYSQPQPLGIYERRSRRRRQPRKP